MKIGHLHETHFKCILVVKSHYITILNVSINIVICCQYTI